MGHRTRSHSNVFEMLSCEDNPSPMVGINKLNPFGSVKDRAAWAVLRDLEDRGELSRDGSGGSWDATERESA